MQKFHPILYSTPMVQAILEDRKTMTRRIVKGLALEWLAPDMFTPEFVADLENEMCPYGKVGDVLWVREMYYAYGYWKKDGLTKTGKQKWRFVDRTLNFGDYRYFENPPSWKINKNSFRELGWYKRSSLFMPKKAARNFLEITDIKIERLQDISEEDAKAEGAKDTLKVDEMKLMKGLGNWIIPSPFLMHQFGFLSIWCKINGCESWLSNPWVWVIEFKRIAKPENFK